MKARARKDKPGSGLIKIGRASLSAERKKRIGDALLSCSRLAFVRN